MFLNSIVVVTLDIPHLPLVCLQAEIFCMLAGDDKEDLFRAPRGKEDEKKLI